MLVSYPDPEWVEAVGPVAGVDAVVWTPGDGPAPGPVEVVVPPLGETSALAVLEGMPSVRLVQLLTAGYDNVLEHVPDGIAVANAVGVHDASTAELAVALALASLRGIPAFVRAADEGRWDLPGRLTSLADRRALIVGYGSVGRAVARRLAPFEVALTAVASRPRGGDDLVDTVHGIDELSSLLPAHDLVVVVVPLTEATRGLVDDGFLSALPDDALVVNVARGPVADTGAILRHAGRLAFALDVTDPEPLPAGHCLYTAPRVLISPHIGGYSTAFMPRAVRMLRDQLARLAMGESPLHLVRPRAIIGS